MPLGILKRSLDSLMLGSKPPLPFHSTLPPLPPLENFLLAPMSRDAKVICHSLLLHFSYSNRLLINVINNNNYYYW